MLKLILIVASLGAGAWAVVETVALMHRATCVMASASHMGQDADAGRVNGCD
jgi:hypothetical protein